MHTPVILCISVSDLEYILYVIELYIVSKFVFVLENSNNQWKYIMVSI